MIWKYSKHIFKCLMQLDDNVTAHEQLQLMYNMVALYENPVDVETLCAYYAVMKNNGWIMPYISKGRPLSMSEIAEIVKKMHPTVCASSCTELFSQCAKSYDAMDICTQCPLSKNYGNARRADEITLMSYILSNGGTAIVDLKSLEIDDLRGCVRSVEFIPYGKKSGCKGFTHNLLGDIADLAIKYSFICVDVDTFWQTAKPMLHTKLKKAHSLSDSESDKYCREFVYSLFRDKREFEGLESDIREIVSRLTAPYIYSPPDILNGECSPGDLNGIVLTGEEKPVTAAAMPLYNDNMCAKISGTTLEDLKDTSLDNLLDVLGINLMPSESDSPALKESVSSEPKQEESGDNLFFETDSSPAPVSVESPAVEIPCAEPEHTESESFIDNASETAAERIADAPHQSSSAANEDSDINSGPESSEVKHEEESVKTAGNYEVVKEKAVIDPDYVSPFSTCTGYSRACIPVIDGIDSVYSPTVRNGEEFLKLEKSLAAADIVSCDIASYNGVVGVFMYVNMEYYFVRYDTDCYGMLHTLFNSEKVVKITFNMYPMAKYIYMHDKVFNNVYSLQELYRVGGSSLTEKIASVLPDFSLTDKLYIVRLIPHYISLFKPEYERIYNDSDLKDYVTMINSSTLMHAVSSDLSKYLKSSVQLTDTGYVYGSVEGVKIDGMLIDINEVNISSDCKVSGPLNRIIMCVFRRLIGSGYVYKYNIKLVKVYSSGVQFYVPHDKDMYELLDILLRVFSSSVYYVTKKPPCFSCTPHILRMTYQDE